MSEFRICSIKERVVIEHVMPDKTTLSELNKENSELLLEQLKIAIKDAFQ